MDKIRKLLNFWNKKETISFSQTEQFHEQIRDLHAMIDSVSSVLERHNQMFLASLDRLQEMSVRLTLMQDQIMKLSERSTPPVCERNQIDQQELELNN